MTGRDECRNFCPENSRKNRKKGLQNRNIHAIIPGVSTRRRTGIGMSPSGKAPDFDSGISSVQIRPSQPYDLLAQSAEQLPFKQWVRGSNPRQVTIGRKSELNSSCWDGFCPNQETRPALIGRACILYFLYIACTTPTFSARSISRLCRYS